MSDEEIRLLGVFQANARKLAQAIEKHASTTQTVHLETDQPIKMEGFVDETVEAGLVVTARLFIGTDTNFNRVLNILSRHYRQDTVKVERLREYKKAWKKIFGLHPLFRLGAEKDGLTGEKIFDIMAYGNHIHSNKFEEHQMFQQSWLYPLMRIQLDDLISKIHRLTMGVCVEFIDAYLETNHSQ